MLFHLLDSKRLINLSCRDPFLYYVAPIFSGQALLYPIYVVSDLYFASVFNFNCLNQYILELEYFCN